MATESSILERDHFSESPKASPTRVSPSANLISFPFAVAIFLGAFLLFFVQLLLGKFILPVFGGAPAVWTTCIMFFQVLLLGGYALAHLLASRFTARKQAVLVLGILAFSVALLTVMAWYWPTPITPGENWRLASSASPSLAIVRLLSAAIGLPFLVLSTTSPMLQNFFRKVHPGASPYRLYALSNAGSLLGLLIYPFLIEPALRLRTQAWFWTGGFIIYAAFYAFCARAANAASPQEFTNKPQIEADETEEERAQPGRPALWIALSFLSSTLLLATTNFICQEIAVIPFLWVLPLSVYLLSFILTFEGNRWYRRNLFHAAFAASATWIVLVSPPKASPSDFMQIASCVVLLFAGCMVCHGEAARVKPAAKHLTKFYLSISSGGALGGIFVSFLAPHLFPGYWEFPLGILGCAGILLALAEKDERSWLHTGRLWVALALTAAIVVLLTKELSVFLPAVSWLQGFRPRLLAFGVALLALAMYAKNRMAIPSQRETSFVRGSAGILFLLLIVGFVTPLYVLYSRATMVSRNFYGALEVIHHMPENYLILMHGQTAHGFQFLRPDLEHLPTGYYGQHSGANILLRNWRRTPVRVGLVGMGVGTLAALGKPRDVYRFYEINPDIPKFSMGAKPVFTFVRDSQANVEIVMGDARLSLEQEAARGQRRQFDVLVLDAFSSDAIPLHLLTREAFEIYLKQLHDEESVIAIHISNRALDLGPVVAGIAKEFQLQAVRVHPAWLSGFSAQSDWILLSHSTYELSNKELKDSSVPFPDRSKPILWSDDFSNLVRVLR